MLRFNSKKLRGHLLPGDKLIVKFPGDYGYGHERMVLWPVFADDAEANEWVIFTEAGHVYCEPPNTSQCPTCTETYDHESNRRDR